MFWALRGSCLYVIVSGGSSWNDTSCAILESVLTWNDPVPLMTMGMTCTSAFHSPVAWCMMACLRGSYSSRIWSVIMCIFVSVEYLHSMSCMIRRPE